MSKPGKPHPTITIQITDIIQTTEDGVLVQLPSGHCHWLPRRLTLFRPGHVIVTPHMAVKIRTAEATA